MLALVVLLQVLPELLIFLRSQFGSLDGVSVSDSPESGSLSGGLLAAGVGSIGAGVGVAESGWLLTTGVGGVGAAGGTLSASSGSLGSVVDCVWGGVCRAEYWMLPTVVAVSLASSSMAWTLRS